MDLALNNLQWLIWHLTIPYPESLRSHLYLIIFYVWNHLTICKQITWIIIYFYSVVHCDSKIH